MSLVTKEELIKATGLSKIGFLKNPVASALMKLSKINEVNKLYDKLQKPLIEEKQKINIEKLSILNEKRKKQQEEAEELQPKKRKLLLK